MTSTIWKYAALVVSAVGAILLWTLTPADSAFKRPVTWQRLAEPGDLSEAHAHLEDNCAACHTAVSGVPTTKCIVCHANNESLLQRQPTSFHASISSCRECHPEHFGRDFRPTGMDHEALVEIGLRQLDGDDRSEQAALRREIMSSLEQRTAPHPHVSVTEAVLNCATCHTNDDRHSGLFGQDCVQCHTTDRWTIPEFRHPSSRSMDCAQCHQAPPSHYMMHFHMVSARVAGKPHADVEQCFECHQTTSWNDIRGVGWYKHH